MQTVAHCRTPSCLGIPTTMQSLFRTWQPCYICCMHCFTRESNGPGLWNVREHSHRLNRASPEPQCWFTMTHTIQSFSLWMCCRRPHITSFPDRSEQPIAFASHTLLSLASSERNYAQVEKISLVFRIKN